MRKVSRGDFLRLSAAGLGGTILGVGPGAHAQTVAEHGGYPDALTHQVMSELDEFVAWLRRPAVAAKGYVGEVQWPNGLDRADKVPVDDYDRWNALGERWYTRADAAGLDVTAWCADERQRWGGFWLCSYTSARDDSGPPWNPISVPQLQAPVQERHPQTSSYRRGINVAGAGAHLNVADFSNQNRGVYDVDYWYASRQTFDYLYSRGVRTVRLPFRWERIQPVLGANLEAEELRRLKECVGRAGNAGLKVVLDAHNYAQYYDAASGKLSLGSTALPADLAVNYPAYSRSINGRKSLAF